MTIEVTLYDIRRRRSCCSKLSKSWELEKDGGIYTEHVFFSLSRVTEIAIACSFNCFSVSVLWLFLTVQWVRLQ